MESLAAPGLASAYFAASFFFAGWTAREFGRLRSRVDDLHQEVMEYLQVMELVDDLDADAEPDAQSPSIAETNAGGTTLMLRNLPHAEWTELRSLTRGGALVRRSADEQHRLRVLLARHVPAAYTLPWREVVRMGRIAVGMGVLHGYRPVQ